MLVNPPHLATKASTTTPVVSHLPATILPIATPHNLTTSISSNNNPVEVTATKQPPETATNSNLQDTDLGRLSNSNNINSSRQVTTRAIRQ